MGSMVSCPSINYFTVNEIVNLLIRQGRSAGKLWIGTLWVLRGLERWRRRLERGTVTVPRRHVAQHRSLLYRKLLLLLFRNPLKTVYNVSQHPYLLHQGIELLLIHHYYRYECTGFATGLSWWEVHLVKLVEAFRAPIFAMVLSCLRDTPPT